MKPTSAECKKSTWPHSQLRLPRTARIWLLSLSVVELCRCRSLSLIMLIFESVLQKFFLIECKTKILVLCDADTTLDEWSLLPCSPVEFPLNLCHQFAVQIIKRRATKEKIIHMTANDRTRFCRFHQSTPKYKVQFAFSCIRLKKES